MNDHRRQLADAVLAWCERDGPQGVITTDSTLHITLWNRWLVEATGLHSEDVVGRSLFDVVPSLVERGFDQYYSAALAGEVKVLSHAFHRYVVPAAAGRTEQMPQAGRIVPLTAAGRIVGTMTIIEDVTERLANDRELRGRIATAESASRIKDEFLATLSHEIRTPLNAVLGWIRILRAKPDVDGVTLQRALEVIDRNAAAQLTLVSDMLDMSRISSGKVRIETTNVDLGAVALAATDVVRPAADAKGVRLVTDLSPHLPVVSGDYDRLLQVAWNMLANGVKFTDSGGQVTIRVAALANSVSLSVTDTGQGIAAAFLPHVFERFRQADPSSSRRQGGLGLGLALVKNLVELHGGTVSVASDGIGHGSTFEIVLPARDGRPVPIASVRVPGNEVAANGALAGLRVMLVDDDADSAELFMRTVADAGARAVWESSVLQAVDRLEGHPQECPHVIVSDIAMPDHDGYALVRQLRRLPPECGGAVPVIALTAYVTPEDRTRALRGGFEAHVGKPCDPEVLIAAILRAAGV